jgi:hypothetical protein
MKRKSVQLTESSSLSLERTKETTLGDCSTEEQVTVAMISGTEKKKED